MCICRKLLCGVVVWTVALGVFPAWAQQEQRLRSIDGLIYDLSHPDGDRRKTSAKLLGQHKDSRAVPGLIKLAADEDGLIRMSAVRALVQINDLRALDTYVRLSHDSRKDVQAKAIEGIISVHTLGGRGLVTNLKKLVGTVNPFGDDYNPLIVEPYVVVRQDVQDALAALLSWQDEGIRRNAVIALGILRAHSVLQPMENALKNETRKSVKVELIRAFYKIGDPSVGSVLIPLIADPDKKIHDEAIFALGRLRVFEAVPQLKKLYESGVEERRKILGFVPVSGRDDLQKKLLEALAYIGDPSCRDLFLSILTDSRELYRLHAAEGLGRIGDSSYVTRVGQQYLRERSARVKLALNYALYHLEREEHLIEIVKNLDKDQAYYYLLEMNAKDVPQLYPYLKEADSSIRIRLLEITGLRGDLSAVPIIQEIAESPNKELASAANLALRRILGRSSAN